MADEKQTFETELVPTFEKEDSPKRSPTPPADEAHILNRLIWDESYDSTDFLIGYEDRFEGCMEASVNSWKRDKMPQKRHRIDFSLLRRRQNLSSTSSSSLSPTVPVLESPISFHALSSQHISEATLKQCKLNRAPVKPSMFFEDKEEDDDGSVPNLTSGDHKDGRTPRTAHKSSVEERPFAQPKSQFFEDSLRSRSPWVSSSAHIGQDSLVVIEIKLNISSESFMVVTVQQIVSLRFGNSALPAYSMKIFALPYLIAPITNLRSTILIQAALQDILHISPARGVILYIPVPEENMATNSTTMMGEIARLERDTHDREPGIFKSLSRSLSRRKKSSSGVSAPLSVATTSSWAAGSDTQEKKPVAASESEGTNASGKEGNARSGKSSRTLRLFVSQLEGDLFDAPDGAALIHACNCFGSWGGGIALAFRKNYPAAFEIYKEHCRKYKIPQYLDASEANTSTSQVIRKVRLPEATTLIIPPQRSDYEQPLGKKHWIICLFTSRGFGRKLSSVEVILQNTKLAIADMKKQLEKPFGPEYSAIVELRACRFNSGLFGVDWALTREILDESGLEVTVVRPPGE
ncbi:hypothetical protein BJX76DRAFT_344704 [Aspergillus varians]